MDNNLVTYIFKWQIEALKGFFAFIFMSYLGTFADGLQCHEGSKPYNYAHSLSQERLEKIYTDFRNYALAGKEIKRITKRSKNRPVEFEDLEYTRLILSKQNIEDGIAILRLGFCMDESIDIELEGLLGDNPIIKLAWGELERTKEILWQKNK